MSDSGSNHFHMTLPSNASMDIYPNNTNAQYKTKLPKHIELTGEWQVSLKEISIPMTLVNISPNSYTVQIFDTTTDRVVVVKSMPSQMYTVISSVTAELTKLTLRNYHIAFRTQLQEGRRWVRLDVNSVRYSIRLNSRLAELLGWYLADRIFERGRHMADVAPTIPGIEQMHNLYVYCDILENVIVGDSSAPLLRIVEVTRDIRRTMIHTIINTPLFAPVQKKSFDTISIWIMTNEGLLAPFPSDVGGKSHVVLEFKKSGLLNDLI